LEKKAASSPMPYITANEEIRKENNLFVGRLSRITLIWLHVQQHNV